MTKETAPLCSRQNECRIRESKSNTNDPVSLVFLLMKFPNLQPMYNLILLLKLF